MSGYEYRVLTTRDSALQGRFDFDELEARLNDAGRAGWRVVSAVKADNFMKSARSNLVVLIERELAGEH